MSQPPTLLDGRPPAQGRGTGAAVGTTKTMSEPSEPNAAAGLRRMSLQQSDRGFRRLPDSVAIARRRRLLRWTKWVLPVGALLLLASIAAWPELQRSLSSARLGLAQATRMRLDSGHMLGPRYRGFDGHDRPYMITAEEAQQVSTPAAPEQGARKGTQPDSGQGDRINLTRPIADSLTAGGDWIRISALDGVYTQRAQILDMIHDVSLYRNDGIMMNSPMADFDVKRGIVASDAWIHAEGPFGVLDAQGYVLSQRDGLAQFRGPARLVLNDDHIARPAATAPAQATDSASSRASSRASSPARAASGGGSGGA